MLQFRNAFDIGGLYFSANLLLSQVSVVACALLYHLYYEDDAGDAHLNLENSLGATSANSTAEVAAKLTEVQLKGSLGSLFTIFLISFTLFMLKIERKYVKTFFSTQTGKARAMRNFQEGSNASDYSKSLIFQCSKYQWMSIRPQVAQWLDQNWDEWEREKPEWFNALFIDSVDDDIMPARVLARLKQEADGGIRRRSSLMERMSARVVKDQEEERGSDSDSSGGEEEG